MQPLSCDLWLIERTELKNFVNMAGSRFNLSLEEVRASRAQSSRQKTIALIPVHGVLEARSSLIGEMLGMTSYESVGNMVDMAMADETVSGVIFDVMSPGGMAIGAPELAQKIYSYRGTKPMVSVANHVATSGAYWIAAAADRMVMSPSGLVGSVGVVSEHISLAKQAEDSGVEVTVTTSTNAPYKAEGSDLLPLSDEAKQHRQAIADEIHSNFAADLARFRGVSVEHVNQYFGKGRVVTSKDAMKAGMVDNIGTFHETAMKMASGRIRIASNRAEDVWDGMTVQEQRKQRAEELRALSLGEIVQAD